MAFQNYFVVAKIHCIYGIIDRHVRPDNVKGKKWKIIQKKESRSNGRRRTGFEVSVRRAHE